ncbi:hypothetical protein JHK82_036294 [Glycine max]|nr:hypothetical protein JHK82_036294 [Glycine max]
MEDQCSFLFTLFAPLWLRSLIFTSKVLDRRVQRKSHTKVELLSPILKPPAEEEKKPQKEEKPKSEEKKLLNKVFTKLLDKVLLELLDRVVKSLNVCNPDTLSLDAVKNPWRCSCSYRV